MVRSERPPRPWITNNYPRNAATARLERQQRTAAPRGIYVGFNSAPIIVGTRSRRTRGNRHVNQFGYGGAFGVQRVSIQTRRSAGPDQRTTRGGLRTGIASAGCRIAGGRSRRADVDNNIFESRRRRRGASRTDGRIYNNTFHNNNARSTGAVYFARPESGDVADCQHLVTSNRTERVVAGDLRRDGTNPVCGSTNLGTAENVAARNRRS